MDDAMLVRMGQRAGDLAGVAKNDLGWQTASRYHIGQRLALHVFHHDVGDALGLADLVDGADVRMVEPRGVLGLAPEPRLGQRLVAGNDLDRNLPVEHSVGRLVDLTHAADPNARPKLVVGEPPSGQRRSDGGLGSGGGLEKVSGGRVGIQQSLQGRACLGIVATRFGQESRPLVGGPLQCVVEQVLHALPALRAHGRDDRLILPQAIE